MGKVLLTFQACTQDGTSQWHGQSQGWFLSLVYHLLEYEKDSPTINKREKKNTCHVYPACGPMDMVKVDVYAYAWCTHMLLMYNANLYAAHKKISGKEWSVRSVSGCKPDDYTCTVKHIQECSPCNSSATY